MKKIPTFDIVCHRSCSWFLLIVDQFVPIEIARDRNGATRVPKHASVVTIAPPPSTRTSMSAGHMGVPIRRANLTDGIGLMADMVRPW
jgi:hypothetical protein